MWQQTVCENWREKNHDKNIKWEYDGHKDQYWDKETLSTSCLGGNQNSFFFQRKWLKWKWKWNWAFNAFNETKVIIMIMSDSYYSMWKSIELKFIFMTNNLNLGYYIFWVISHTVRCIIMRIMRQILWD